MAITTQIQPEGLALYNDNNERTLVRPSASAPNVILALPTTSGTLALEGAGGTSDIVKKAYDSSVLRVESSTTFEDVVGINFEATSGKYYDVELFFYTHTGGAAQNHKFRWNGAGLTARQGSAIGVQSTNTNSGTASIVIMRPFDAPTGSAIVGTMTIANDFNYAVSYRCLMLAGATGTAQFQFAQNSSSADYSQIDTVYLRVREVAF